MSESTTKNTKTINIPISKIEEACSLTTLKLTNDNVHSWVNELIDDAIARTKYQSAVYPDLSIAAVSSDGVIVKHVKKDGNNLSEIVFQGKILHCTNCDQGNCHHIDFLRSSPSLGKMIREHLKI